MITQVISVFDKGAAVYGPPFFVRHIAEARRSVQQALRDKNTMLAQYPEQFVVFRLGTFDDAKGVFEQSQAEILCEVSELATEVVVSRNGGV